MSHRLVYMTASSLEEAERIGSALVKEKLAACVNYWPGMKSIYIWDGRLQTSDEVVLLAKTRHDKLARLTRRVQELHGYETPCVVALPIEGGNPDFLRWLDAAVSD